MEILVSGGMVGQCASGESIPVDALSIRARQIMNLLPVRLQRCAPVVIHNVDENYTGIRFTTKRGFVVLEMSAGDRPYRLVQQFDEPDELGRMEVELRQIPKIYKPHGVAFIVSEFLLSRGFLSA
ncbi:hypothetical protein [Streptomyces sp. NPDC094468]|uniref:hypothetical protein n=1 Tax=Streptomyces sp. NPDC094468 TaxID=3366066 RepID=UPI0038205C30